MILDAWIDETAGKGIVGNLEQSRDHDFALFVALLIREDERNSIHNALLAPYKKFKEHTPPGEKIHITDAFTLKEDHSPKYPEWFKAAKEARDDIFATLKQYGRRVIYGARRFELARSTGELGFKIRQEAKNNVETRQGNIRFAQVRKSSDRVDGEAFRDLVFLMRVGAAEFQATRVQPIMDHVDQALLQNYQTEIKETDLNRSYEITSKAFNTETKRQVIKHGEFTVTGPHQLHDDPAVKVVILDPKIDDDVGPELLAVDIVANSLAKHLYELAADANLYGPDATKDWKHAGVLALSNEEAAIAFGLY